MYCNYDSYCCKSNIIMNQSLHIMQINVEETPADYFRIQIYNQRDGIISLPSSLDQLKLIYLISILKSLLHLNNILQYAISFCCWQICHRSNWIMLLFSKSCCHWFCFFVCLFFPLGIMMLKNLHHAVIIPCNGVLTFCCNPAWIHIKCDCIPQHLPGSTVVWLPVFNLLKCTLAFFHDIERLKLASSLRIRLPLTRACSYLHVLLMPKLWGYWALFFFLSVA